MGRVLSTISYLTWGGSSKFSFYRQMDFLRKFCLWVDRFPPLRLRLWKLDFFFPSAFLWSVDLMCLQGQYDITAVFQVVGGVFYFTDYKRRKQMKTLIFMRFQIIIKENKRRVFIQTLCSVQMWKTNGKVSLFREEAHHPFSDASWLTGLWCPLVFKKKHCSFFIQPFTG